LNVQNYQSSPLDFIKENWLLLAGLAVGGFFVVKSLHGKK
jgi:hypothetical protein